MNWLAKRNCPSSLPLIWAAGTHLLSALENCQASVGAACHAHNVSRPSPVLLAIGVPEKIAVNALRVSVGRETTKEDIDIFLHDLKNAIQKLQA